MKEFKNYKVVITCEFWDEVPTENGWEYRELYNWERFVVVKATSPKKAESIVCNMVWNHKDSTLNGKYKNRKDVLKMNEGVIDTDIDDFNFDLMCIKSYTAVEI